MARQFARLLAIKDEYEVARLYTDGRFQAALAEQFEDAGQLNFHLAPPCWRGAGLTAGRARCASARG
ncbi:MAG: DUF6537 domain-containing protein [Burkholderiaceae bacterium]